MNKEALAKDLYQTNVLLQVTFSTGIKRTVQFPLPSHSWPLSELVVMVILWCWNQSAGTWNEINKINLVSWPKKSTSLKFLIVAYQSWTEIGGRIGGIWVYNFPVTHPASFCVPKMLLCVELLFIYTQKKCITLMFV